MVRHNVSRKRTRTAMDVQLVTTTNTAMIFTSSISLLRRLHTLTHNLSLFFHLTTFVHSSITGKMLTRHMCKPAVIWFTQRSNFKAFCPNHQTCPCGLMAKALACHVHKVWHSQWPGFKPQHGHVCLSKNYF